MDDQSFIRKWYLGRYQRHKRIALLKIFIATLILFGGARILIIQFYNAGILSLLTRFPIGLILVGIALIVGAIILLIRSYKYLRWALFSIKIEKEAAEANENE